jgi:hypothetical protein
VDDKTSTVHACIDTGTYLIMSFDITVSTLKVISEDEKYQWEAIRSTFELCLSQRSTEWLSALNKRSSHCDSEDVYILSVLCGH